MVDRIKELAVPRFLMSAVALTFAAAVPAFAQDAPEEKVNQLIIYGDDACPPSTDGEITVCARKAEAERYRIPEALRQSSSPENTGWNDRVLAYETVGRTGAQSCSPVGAGGMTGCVSRLINTAYAEKASDPNIRFSQLIADERAKRLATIDADAAETQARVEALEREYEARQNAQLGGGNAEPVAPAKP